jgi:hypothetical protein
MSAAQSSTSSGGGGGAAGPGFLALLFGLLCLKNLPPNPTRKLRRP